MKVERVLFRYADYGDGHVDAVGIVYATTYGAEYDHDISFGNHNDTVKDE